MTLGPRGITRRSLVGSQPRVRATGYSRALVQQFIDRAYWPALLNGYRGADAVISDLNSVLELLLTMVAGTAESTRSRVDRLSDLTLRADLWLHSNPCPEPWYGEHLQAVVIAFWEARSLIAEAGGDVAAVEGGALDAVIDESTVLLNEVRSTISPLARRVDV